MKKVLVLLLVIGMVRDGVAQVNMTTGSATFGLPMFNWQDDKSRLNAVVSLNYNSGNGLKVNDVATCVGQGWNLIAGGVITRLKAGEPDDQMPYDAHNDDVGDATRYPPGLIYNPNPPFLGCLQAQTKYPIFGGKNHVYKQHNTVVADVEADHFAFQFNGRSGIFVIGQINNDVGVFLGDSKLKVWFERNENMVARDGTPVRTAIDKFKIQDENGLIYVFSTHETTKVLKTAYTDKNFISQRTQPDFKGGNVYYEGAFDDPAIHNPNTINSWYLTEIDDPLTSRKITFNYTFNNINAGAGNSISYFLEKGYSIISHAISKTITPAIASIDYPDGHHVIFNYGKPRIDLPGDNALASVDINYQGRYLSRYDLATSYFILNRYGNTPTGDYQRQAARLCLLSVKKTGVDLKEDDQPYLFDYYLGSSTPGDFVPPPFFHLKDIWGFYNADNNHDAQNNSVIPYTMPFFGLSISQTKGLCFINDNSTAVILNPKPGYAKNGLLKQIVYPTGGALKYDYEQNMSYLNNQNTNVGGVHVSKTYVTDGDFSNGCGNPIITNYTYTTDITNTKSSLWIVEMPANSIQTQSHYEPEKKYLQWKPLFTVLCSYRYMYPGILSRDQSVSLTATQQILMALSSVLDIVSGVMEVLDVINLCLDATPAAWVAVIIDFVVSVGLVVYTCLFQDLSKDETNTVFYNTDVNAVNPLPSQFKRVDVSEGSGANGRTIYQFYSPDNYDIWNLTNPTLSMRQRYAYWAYGLPWITTVLDAAGNKVKQVENVYDHDPAKVQSFILHPFTHAGYTSCKCKVLKSTSQRDPDWANPALYTDINSYVGPNDNNTDLKADVYNFYSGRFELSDSYERTYSSANPLQYLETTTHYTYNQDNYQVSEVKTTQSNGDENYKHIYYSIDYNYQYTGPLAIMQQNNIVAEPVSTVSWFIKSGNTARNYISEDVTEFTTTANGSIKPYRTLEQRFSQPQSSISTYSPGGSTSAYKVTKKYTYDALSNLIGMVDEGGRTISNLYDYNSKYVVASVINADPGFDQLGYTSFEADGTGGFSLNTAGITGSDAVTGNKSYSINNGMSKGGLTPAKTYIVSLWTKNGTPSNNGYNGTSVVVADNASWTTGITINGWTYLEKRMTGVNIINISGGGGLVDEVRIYPQNARMKTVTYDPLIGKTSECDENNRINYYEYDGLGRLRFVKDDRKNVIKMYEYNYAVNRPSPCSVTYGNNAITEVFTRNDCGPGYIGTDVPYTIPAGKYTSTISQALADLQAEYELLAMGQYNANDSRYGHCLLLYYNDAQSQSFTKEDCPDGTVGTTVTYAVPAGKYWSTISGAANQMALDEINANGQALANNRPVSSACIFDATPVWIGTGLTQCQAGNTGHLLVQAQDMNPNSSSFNQIEWKDAGPDPSCPIAPCTTCTDLSQQCINNVCETGLKAYTDSYLGGDGFWVCVFHYEWSDGTWSPDYREEHSGGQCPLQ